jgi:putative transposase
MDPEIFENRRVLYEKAKAAHPKRWSGEIQDWSLEKEAWLNPERLHSRQEFKKACQPS